MKYKPLPFGIDFVIQTDLATMEGFRKWPASQGSYDITCPFCGAERRFNVNPNLNVAKCNKTGDGYNTTTLHAALTGLDNKTALADLYKRWEGLPSDAQVKLSVSATQNNDYLIPAPLEIRDKIYRAFLNELTLSEKHREDCLKRGLTDDEIRRLNLKTVPITQLHSAAYKAVYESGVITELKNKKWGIPGFTDLHDPEKVSVRGRRNGYFIPVMTRDGLISGMQIRYDPLPENASDKEKENYRKYTWYSSAEKETGCSVTGCENIHFSGEWNVIPETINLTEGVLKADVASFLSGKPFMGLVGVSNTGQLKDELFRMLFFSEKKELLVDIYVDMDYREKPEVASALSNIKKCINKTGTHDYRIKASENVDAIYIYSGETYKDGSLCIDLSLPEKFIVYLDQKLLDKKYYQTYKNSIVIDPDFISSIKNSEHTIRVVKINEDFKNYSLLSLENKKEILRNNLCAMVTFEKTGSFKYRTRVWDHKYKGIDDYLLWMKQFKNETN